MSPTTRHPAHTLTLITRDQTRERLRCTGRTLDHYQESGVLHPIGHAGEMWYRTDEVAALDKATREVMAEIEQADPLAGGRGLLIGFLVGTCLWTLIGGAVWAVAA